jgi:hypothetical protein
MRTHGTPYKATIIKNSPDWDIFLQPGRRAALPARCSVLYIFSGYVCWPNVTDGSAATQSCPARCPAQVHRTGAASGAAAVHQLIAIVEQK